LTFIEQATNLWLYEGSPKFVLQMMKERGLLSPKNCDTSVKVDHFRTAHRYQKTS